MSKAIKDISEKMIERYSVRYQQLGYDVKTLGWGTTEQQRYRFMQSLTGIQFSGNKTVLDIGCGFGDFLALLLAEKKTYKKYTGWDLNPNLIMEAKRIWKNSKSSNFETNNIGELKSGTNTADIVLMFGVLNLNLMKTMDNYEYSFQLMKNAFSLAKDVLVVDFLSTNFTSAYLQEDFVFYHSPSKMLDFALSLTSNVVLKHNYAPIPQKEFMLFLYK